MPTTLPMRLHGGVRNNPAPATMSQHIVLVGVKGSPDRPTIGIGSGFSRAGLKVSLSAVSRLIGR